MVFFNYFLSSFVIFFFLSVGKSFFFRFEIFKNQKKIEKITRFQKCLQIRIPGGLIDHFQLVFKNLLLFLKPVV